MSQENNIRIARNTVIIYVRMAVTIIAGLISSRLVLQALGASDVGIYSAVGSTVALVAVVTGALAVTTQRFMNIELGRPDGDPNRMFNICHTIHLGGAALLFVLLETIGLWYIRFKLNVPPGKSADAMFVFQVSTLVACMGISNVPFQSIFTVHEKFSVTAAVDIVNALVKLALVVSLLVLRNAGNGLRIYALLMSVTTWISFVVYRVLSRRRWPETVRWNFVRDRHVYREVLSFSNYNILSASAVIARGQGSNMLINAFFGTTVNAAFFYASTVQNYVNQFIGNFDTAAAPRIVQGIGAKDEASSIALTEKVGRICLLLFFLLFFPLWCDLEFVLRLWLGSRMPAETVVMCRWTLLVAAVASTSAGIVQLINAYGRIKWYKIQGAFFFLACLPAGYWLFRAGKPAYSIIICFIVADVLSRVVQFILLRIHFRFPVGRFIREAWLRPAIAAGIMCIWLFIYRMLPLEGSAARLSGILLTLLLTAIVMFFVGLKSGERRKIRKYCYRKWNEWSWDHAHKCRVQAIWKKKYGHRIDWKDPADLNEKIQWLICFSDTSRWTELSDKIKVRDYVEAKGLGGLLVPLLGIWEKSSDIPFDALPERFVLKCNHDSHSTHIIGPDTDREAVSAALDAALKVRLGYKYGETFYNPIEPRIIAEEYLDSGELLPTDYKVWCFDGKPYCIMTCSDRMGGALKLDVYDTDWHPREGVIVSSEHYMDGGHRIPRPETLEAMLSAASHLAEGFPEVRVDFYEIKGRLYFGEMTFASASGMMDYFTPEFLREMGEKVGISAE